MAIYAHWTGLYSGLALKIIYMLSNETPSPVEFVHAHHCKTNLLFWLSIWLLQLHDYP